MRLTARHERLPLHTPFRIARGAKTVADVVVVTLDDGERRGQGEGVSYARYGEDVPGTLAEIEGVRAAMEGGADRDALLDLLPAGAARNALDAALWDLAGDAPPAPGPIASALTIAIDTPAAMATAAVRHAGAPLLKVKLDADDPAARLRAVRAAAPGPRLIVDANESWDRALLDAMRPVLAECRVTLLEQPVAAGDDAWLEGYDAGVPICADEAFHGLADLDRVARRYQAVNIKLDKTGGLTAALAIAAAARTRGLGVMTGCMICSSLSIAPALRIAALSDVADLDGPLWLAADRTGGVRDVDGMLHPPAPGFWG